MTTEQQAASPARNTTNPQSTKRPVWLRWVVVAMIVAILAVGVGRALNKRKQTQEEAQAAATRLQAPVVFTLSPEDTVVAMQQTLVQTVSVSGSLRATQSAVVKAKVAGELQGLQVREGDVVQAGQILARIDTTEYQARVQQAERQAQAAAAQVAIAERAQSNNQALVQQGFISPTALETSRGTLEGAQFTHKAALAAADIARKALTDTDVRSPIAGQVSTRTVQNGERVGIDARILEVVDLRELEVEAALTPADAALARVGQAAQLTVEGLQQPVPAKVARISPAAQAGSRSVMVYLKVAQVAGLRHGLFVNGSIQVGTTQGVAIPLTAIRNDKPQPYVQLLQPLTTQDDGAQAEVVHQTVRELARGLPIQPSGAGLMMTTESIANNSMMTSASAGFLQEKTRIRISNPSAPSPGATSSR